LGIIIRSIAVGYAAPNTSGRNVVKQKADSLNTSGIYSIVRHPLYLGNSLIWLGISMRLQMFWVSLSVMLFFWMYYEKIMFAEEEYLRGKFGKAYTDWANSTPTLFPNFKKWRKNTNKFSFKKVLRQENDGVYALIIILFFIELSADYFHDFDINISLFWIYIISVFTFLYLLVKLLKKQTKLLK
jgi:protein-S-isoprenylcysteine O-methyltransferase Ste14